MATKVNFTKEHFERLKTLALIYLIGGNQIKALMGTSLTIYDLFHTVTVNTLITLNSNLKKEAEMTLSVKILFSRS